jgi:hypothetical protein
LALLVAIAAAGGARAQDFTVPPTLLIPNYDRVYPGLIEALEGGAFAARARNAPALFYNPAGIALSDRTVLNASAQGYQLTTLSGSGFEQTSGGAFETLPSFVGLVLGKEVIDWERVRIGFAVVHPVHSDLTVIASTTPAEGQRASYSVHSSFDTLTPTFSVGWALAPSLRLGGSIEFPYTSLSSTGELSGEITDATSSRSTLRTLAATGSVLHLRGTFGVQWDVLSWFKLGALVRTPGLKIKTSGSSQYEALTVVPRARGRSSSRTATSTSSTSCRSRRSWGGLRVRAIRHRDRPQVARRDGHLPPVRLHQDASGGGHHHRDPGDQRGRLSRCVLPRSAALERSVGAHFALSENFIISAGSYLDYSPVDPAVGKAFRKVDVVGFRAGVAFRIDNFSAAIGGGWEHGTGLDNLFPPGGLPIPEETSELTLNTFTLLFSVSFKF